jgi:endoglucanase
VPATPRHRAARRTRWVLPLGLAVVALAGLSLATLKPSDAATTAQSVPVAAATTTPRTTTTPTTPKTTAKTTPRTAPTAGTTAKTTPTPKTTARTTTAKTGNTTKSSTSTKAATTKATSTTKSSSTTTPTSSTTAKSTTAAAAAAATGARPAALTGALYVDPKSAAAEWVAAHPTDSRAATIRSRIATVPTGRWFLRDDDAQWVSAYVSAASAQQRVPLLVAYHLPYRDCGSYSAGGATSTASYQSWISSFAAGIGSAKAVVLLEPDSLYYTSCLSASQLSQRLSLLQYAIGALAQRAPNAVVYLDGGTPVHGTTVDQMADLLVQAGVAKTRGFAVNINNFKVDGTAYDYGLALRSAVAERTGTNPSWLLDTSRNGSAVGDTLWCNPPGAHLGRTPAWFYGTDGLDGAVWFKRPGESDGSCGTSTGSTSGQFVPELAAALAG